MNMMTTPLPAGMQALADFDHARHSSSPQVRLHEVRNRAQALHERMMAEPEVLFYRSFNLIRVPYPTDQEAWCTVRSGRPPKPCCPSRSIGIARTALTASRPSGSITFEVNLNGNTLEGSNDQYISVVLEKALAGRSANPDYPNCATSSERTPFWAFPGDVASHLFGEAHFGQVQRQTK